MLAVPNDNKKKHNQWIRWAQEVIPEMKGLYLVYLQETNFLRTGGNIDIPRCSQECRRRNISVSCVLFDGK
jgi:hypothetical protein